VSETQKKEKNTIQQWRTWASKLL